jgi:hypothetical protein
MPELNSLNSLLGELQEELSRYDLNDPIIVSRQTLLVALRFWQPMCVKMI